MGTGKDETGNGRVLLAEFSHQVNHSSQSMPTRIDDSTAQEITKMPNRAIRIQRLFHFLPQSIQPLYRTAEIGGKQEPTPNKCLFMARSSKPFLKRMRPKSLEGRK
jgi:hypothetical protein